MHIASLFLLITSKTREYPVIKKVLQDLSGYIFIQQAIGLSFPDLGSQMPECGISGNPVME